MRPKNVLMKLQFLGIRKLKPTNNAVYDFYYQTTTTTTTCTRAWNMQRIAVTTRFYTYWKKANDK